MDGQLKLFALAILHFNCTTVVEILGHHEELWVKLVFGRFESWRCIWLV